MSRTVVAEHRLTDMPLPGLPVLGAPRRVGGGTRGDAMWWPTAGTGPTWRRTSPVRVAPLLAPLPAERPHALSAADTARAAPPVAARAAGQRTVDVSHAVSESRPTRSMPGDRAHSRPTDTTPGREHRSTRAVGTTARATAPRRRAAHVTRSTTSATHPERRPATPRPTSPPSPSTRLGPATAAGPHPRRGIGRPRARRPTPPPAPRLPDHTHRTRRRIARRG